MTKKLTSHFNITTLFAGLLVMLLGFPSLSYGESLKTDNIVLSVSGTVTGSDDGLPLIGASVIVKGTSTGVTTNIDGQYKIEAQPTDVLVFSYTGMEKKEIAVNGQATIDVVLSSDTELLGEVVVVGYGTRKK